MSEHTPLTEAERESIRWGIERDWQQAGDGRDWIDTFATVERILAARTSTADTGLRERVEALADWCAAKEADYRASQDAGGYAEGARDAYDVTESRLREALDATAAPTTDTGARYPRDTDSPALDWIDGARDE